MRERYIDGTEGDAPDPSQQWKELLVVNRGLNTLLRRDIRLIIECGLSRYSPGDREPHRPEKLLLDKPVE